MQSEDLPIILDTLKELAATKIGWLAITRKNYAGRHDQQMHTTLFNIANPSQGREAMAKPNLELSRADTSDQSMAGFTGYRNAADIWSRITAGRMEKLLEAASERADTQDNFTRGAFEAALASKRIRATDEHLIASDRRDKHFDATFKKIVNDEIGGYLRAWNIRLNESEQAMKNDFGNIRAFARFLSYKGLFNDESGFGGKSVFTTEGIIRAADNTVIPNSTITHLAIQMLRIIRMDTMDNRIASRKDKDLEDNISNWKGTKSQTNPLRGVSYDGVLDMVTQRPLPDFRTQMLSPKVSAGRESLLEIWRLGEKMGFPMDKIVISGTPSKQNASATFTVGTQNLTVFPAFYNSNNNTRNSIRAIMNHETTHYRYLAIEKEIFGVGGLDRTGVGGKMPTTPYGVSLGRASTRDGINPLVKLLLTPETLYRVGETRLSTGKFGLSPERTNVEKEVIALIKSDGISGYSQKFWRDFAVFPSIPSLRLAIEETLSEVAHARTGRTKTEQQYISPLWLKASKAFNDQFNSIAKTDGN